MRPSTANANAAVSPTELLKRRGPRPTWRTLTRGWDRALRIVFGRDIFISYSRRDGTRYAEAVVLALQARRPRLSFYLDRWIAPASLALPRSLRRQLRWSSLMVVICTENAVSQSS